MRIRRSVHLHCLVASLILLGSGPPPATAQLLGAEFQVNSYTHSHQRYPAVAADDPGNFVVVWQSFGQDGSSYGVFGRRFDATGNPLASDFQVNTYTTGLQPFPAVAMLSGGAFIVAWASPQEDGWNWGILAQLYDAIGSPVGSEFHVNSYTTSGQYSPAIAADGTGNFVVTWESQSQDGSDTGVFARRFDSAGVALGGEFQVNVQTVGYQDSASVAQDALGNFVVVWESRQQNGSSSRILGRRFDTTGAPLGDEFQINSYTASWQKSPVVASDGSGRFAVAWESHQQAGPLSDVHARSFDPTGGPEGDEFPVNSYTTSDQFSPAVAMDGSGSFVVTWSSFEQDGWYLGVFAQRFSPVGSRVGNEQRVSTFPSASQGAPALATGASGNFVVVWESRYQDGSSFGVFGQRLSALAFSDGFEIGTDCAWSAAVGGGCP